MIRSSQFSSFRYGSHRPARTLRHIQADQADTRAKLLAFIATYQAEHGGVSPAFPEMAKAIGSTSKGYIFRLLDTLVAEGRIRRMKNRARALQIVTPLTWPNADYWIWDATSQSLVPMQRGKT